MGPAVVLVGVVILLPACYAVYASFVDLRFFQDNGYVGTANYEAVLTSTTFMSALVRSVVFTFLCLAISMPMALGLALLAFSMKNRGNTLMAWMLAPWALAPFAVALIWKWILASGSMGLLNQVLEFLSLGPVALLAESTPAFLALTGVAVWRTFAFGALVLFAGMSQIPKDLFSAAAVDGASFGSVVWRIILPLLRPSVLAAGVVLTISYFNEVQLIVGMTSGGPLNATTTLPYELFQVGIIDLNQGQASALSLVMLIINLFLVVAFSMLTTRIGSRARGKRQ
jgi:ABC-type sugar transport system permease subunit